MRGRSPELIAVYSTLEAVAKSLGTIELVARERYVLFRTTRIFADVVIMAACVRLAMHLPHKVEHAAFSKIVADKRHVTHVVLLQHAAQVKDIEDFLREAYNFSLR